MRVARRTVLASMLASIAAPGVQRLVRADAPITLKLHHFASSVSSGHDKFAVPWTRKVEAESGGRIRIDIFPSMQLGGTPAQLFDQARDGTVDLAWIQPSLTPGRFPKIEMFELPFVPAQRALVSSKALEDFAAANLKDEFREVHPISFSCGDRGVVHANLPIRTVEDIKDLKLHVQTRFAGEAMRALGAQPVPMPFGQLSLAITAHVVDGCIDPWHVVPPLRLNDLLKTHTEFSDFSVSSTTFVLVMNQQTYDRLPRELKTVIDNNSGQYAAGLAGAMWDLQAAAVADMVVARGDTIVTLLPEAVAHWRKATGSVVDTWLKEMKEQKVDGNKLLTSARGLLAKYASLPEPQSAQTPAPAQQQSVTEPQPRADVKPETPPPKAVTPAASTSAPTPPPAKPVPAPRVATHPPAAAAPATPVATPAPAAPVVKPPPPAPPSPPAVAAAPPPPVTAPPPPPAVAAAPPVPAAAPPAHVPTPPVAPVPKPVRKALDIPL
jgi:TRAP-type C4-dicarboxylate transport system substrate-binding protein